MAEKRKDKKGRVLKTGESQRKDGSYQFRYKGTLGKYVYTYAPTLNELREKEAQIYEDSVLGLISPTKNISVFDLAKNYVGLKRGIKPRTLVNYQTVLNFLENDPFGQLDISIIKTSDAKRWVICLQEECGRSYSSIATIKSVLRTSFESAVEDDLIRKNPFSFKLSKVIICDTNKREAIKMDVLNHFFEFLKNDNVYCKLYDEIKILLGTGLRISELCGLILSDLDFENRKVDVQRQLSRMPDGSIRILPPKTESGFRQVPMTDEVYDAFQNVLRKRKPVDAEIMIDGVCGFVFLNRNGKPRISDDFNKYLTNASNKYRKLYPDRKLPKITPHILRHTFCTNWANEGIGIQSLSYVMGHNDPRVTLKVYTHPSYEAAEKDMKRIMDAKKSKNIVATG